MTMRAQLEAVIDELKRLRDEGAQTIYWEDSTFEQLRERAPVLSIESVASEMQATPQDEPSLASRDSSPASDEGEEASVEVATKAARTPKKAAPSQGLPDGVAPIPDPQPFELPDGDKATRWQWLRDRVLQCPVCREHVEPGKQVVFGVGNLDARIFFCGEAPGADEAEQGEPFVGAAGQTLNRIIQAMGLKREEVYIGNILNWRPEHDKPFGNRKPAPVEMNFCLPYLKAQVDIVRPEVIVALGVTAAEGLLEKHGQIRMRAMRGQWQAFNDIPVILTYHPSYLLHNNTNKTKREIWEDMLAVMERLNMPISEKQRGYFLTAT